MSIETIIRGLTHSEKLDALDLLWRELSRDPSLYTSPEWHRTVLADRIANPATGPALPIGDAMDEVKERLKARRAQG